MTKAQSGVNLKDNAPDGLELSASEQKSARQEGAKEAVKEAAKDAYTALTDGNLPGDPQAAQYPGSDEIMQFAHIIDLGLEQFEETVKAKDGVPENKIAGLLALERGGKNRTPYVKALCKRLGVKSPYEVTDAGPDYTNDISNISKL